MAAALGTLACLDKALGPLAGLAAGARPLTYNLKRITPNNIVLEVGVNLSPSPFIKVMGEATRKNNLNMLIEI